MIRTAYSKLSIIEWRELPVPVPHLRGYQHIPSGLQVVETDGAVLDDDGREVLDDDGREWYHVSCSYSDHTPSYSDLLLMKRSFCPGRTALQIFPPEAQHISGAGIGALGHVHVLHLWVCIDDDDAGLPNFGKFGHI